eukprot:1714870-Prymnesium_polylepis.1
MNPEPAMALNLTADPPAEHPVSSTSELCARCGAEPKLGLQLLDRRPQDAAPTEVQRGVVGGPESMVPTEAAAVAVLDVDPVKRGERVDGRVGGERSKRFARVSWPGAAAALRPVR